MGADVKKPLIISYKNAQGEVKTWHLQWWEEQGFYIVGSAQDNRYRTFRKDRVLEYLSGADQVKAPLASPPPKPKPKKSTYDDDRPQILFTGFLKNRRSELERKSESEGLHVVKTPTIHLAYLCIGANAGPSKVLKARKAGAYILSETQFLQLLETGEIPDEDWD